MYLIVGLGNPEKEYGKTRHNAGFNVINKLAEEYEIEVSKSNFKGLCGTGIIEGKKVLLLKPQTYMNLSGESIVEAKNFYKLSDSDLIIVYDDVDLEPGNIRVRREGSSGTHNGVKSVIYNLNTDKFARVRIGIGQPDGNLDIIAHVIKPLTKEEQEELDIGVTKGKEAVIEIIKNGEDAAMNKFN